MEMAIKIIPASVRFNGCSLITGFHGLGATGFLTVKYLIKKLDAERVAFVDSDIVVPMSYTEGGRIVTPFELYRWGSLVFFKVEVPPYKSEEIGFFKEFADWVTAAGFKEVALIGGLDSKLRVDKSSFRLVRTGAYVPEGELADAELLEDDQIIVGPVAVMLNRFEALRFPAYSILTYASSERIDPRATAATISILSRHYGFTVDLEPLLKGAEAIEMELARQEAQVKRQGENIYT